MTYTILAFNYGHRDFNNPFFIRESEDLAEAKRMAEERFRDLTAYGHGRVVVLPLNPTTGYHDLPAVWERQKPFALAR
ncbi:MAG: hypothetical protein MOB07_26240 [Acidobacteria bacterium]|nr:hypothetical protein [Acidobacteriota bacterium]